VEHEVSKAREDAARIQNDLKFQQESIPAVLGLVGSKGSDDEDDDDGVQGGPGAVKHQHGNEAADEDMEFRIPRSIREIYMISNRNRRNKKTGSPTPERGVTPTSEKDLEELAKADALLEEHGDAVVGYFDETANTSPGKRHKTKSDRDSEETVPDAPGNVATKDDDLAFMKEIGWIKSEDDLNSILNQRFGRSRTGTNEASNPDDAEGDNRPRSANAEVAALGVIHPSMQQPGSNPFFTGAAAAEGASQQQRHLKKPNAVPATTAPANAKGKANRNRQPERPERKDNRTYAYRKR
jgi:hypothetical protein